MITVQDVARWVEGFAPTRLAESWDNVGLLFGDPATAVLRIMTCLTVTPRTAAEAVAMGANVIVSHHPVMFRAIKQLRADQAETAPLWTLAGAGVAVISPHTAFDNCEQGINQLLAKKLELVEVSALRRAVPSTVASQFKLVAFVPEGDHERVIQAAFQAGAGRIGAYSDCSFSIAGQGTFFGLEGSRPSVGQAGVRESVIERRVEFVCPIVRLDRVIAAIRAAHSYEEVAIDVYPLVDNQPGHPGAGRQGLLQKPMTLAEFVALVGSTLKTPSVPFVGDPTRPVERIGICCGAGDDFLPDAIAAGADVLLTGEARFHRALEAEAAGIGLVLPGHHATERPGVEWLAENLRSAFPGVMVCASHSELDPLRSL